MSNRHHEFIINKKKSSASPALRAGGRTFNAQKFAAKPKRSTQREIELELKRRADDNYWNAMFASYSY